MHNDTIHSIFEFVFERRCVVLCVCTVYSIIVDRVSDTISEDRTNFFSF